MVKVSSFTFDMICAASVEAFPGALTIVFTFKSRSSSAVFCDCYHSTYITSISTYLIQNTKN